MTTGEGLCLACGMCCDGTLFSQVLVHESEVTAMRARRLPLVGVPPAMPQPCEQHVGGRCSIYLARPNHCREFRCRLLGRYNAGEVGASEALMRIAELKAMVSSVRARLPSGGVLSLRKLLDANLGEVDDEQWRRDHVELLLDAKLLELALRRHLRHEK